METTTANQRIEIAYRKYGEVWKRKVFKNDAQFDRWYDLHTEDIAELRFAQD